MTCSTHSNRLGHDAADVGDLLARLADARERGLVAVEAEQLLRLGNVYLSKDRPDEADQAFLDLEQLGHQERDQDGIVTATFGKARVAWTRGQTDVGRRHRRTSADRSAE